MKQYANLYHEAAVHKLGSYHLIDSRDYEDSSRMSVPYEYLHTLLDDSL